MCVVYVSFENIFNQVYIRSYTIKVIDECDSSVVTWVPYIWARLLFKFRMIDVGGICFGPLYMTIYYVCVFHCLSHHWSIRGPPGFHHFYVC